MAAETARTLEISGGVTGVAALNAVSRFMGDRHTLLILDNCEHVVDSCADLAARLLGTGPNLRMLATSREPLGVAGETVIPIDPLSAADARRLFVERAAQRKPGFVPRRGGRRRHRRSLRQARSIATGDRAGGGAGQRHVAI